jgi:hypothetical protein
VGFCEIGEIPTSLMLIEKIPTSLMLNRVNDDDCSLFDADLKVDQLVEQRIVMIGAIIC